MSPTHARARGKRFRYYVSTRIKGKARTDTTAWRIPAIELDMIVVQFAAKLLGDKSQLLDWLQAYAPSVDRQSALDAAAILSAQVRSQTSTECRAMIAAIFPKIVLGAETITFELDVPALMGKLVANESGPKVEDAECEPASKVPLALPIQVKRRGNEMRMIVEGTDQQADPDPGLVTLIAKAHLYLGRLIDEPHLSITDLADRLGVDRVDVGRVLPLAFLAPRLTDQILTGNQSLDLSARRMTRMDLPLTWSDQTQAMR